MRWFYLENETGSRKELNNEAGIFLSNPEGLGIEFGGTFADIDNGFFKYAAKKYVQKTFSGTLCFFGNPYQLYREFINWCTQSEKIMLVYSPNGEEYYSDIEIVSIDKKEINRYGYLESEVKLKYLTPWYSPTNHEVNSISEDSSFFVLSADSGNAGSKFVPNPPPGDVLASGFGERFSLQLSSIGHFPAGFKFEYTGAANHPVFILEDVLTGEEIGRCSILKNFVDGSIIEFSTIYHDSYIKERDILGNENSLIGYVDLSTDPFFRIPVGKECKFTIQDDGALNGALKCTIYDYYRSV